MAGGDLSGAAAGGGERSEFERLRAILAECSWPIAGGVLLQAAVSDEISDSEYDELREVAARLWMSVLAYLPEGASYD